VRARRYLAAALFAAGLGSTAHLVTSCGGGGGVCGDGIQDPGEECDDGNTNQLDSCRNCKAYLAPRTTVIWSFNAYPDRGFSGDTCIDVGATKVRVAATGPTNESQDVNCGDGQAVFQDLAAGMYTFAVTPLDANGNPLVTTPGSVAVMAGGAATTVNVNVAWDSWSASHTGSLLFRITWGKQPCALATPPVATQGLTLTVSTGQTVTQLTDTGQKLDGTLGPCRPSTDAFPQSILLLPAGPATLVIVGKDAVGTEQFRHSFDTFVGIGSNNPTLTYDVSVDAAPDAGVVVDAAVADAPAD
jgi:cysteine-rich repeat protein